MDHASSDIAEVFAVATRRTRSTRADVLNVGVAISLDARVES
jgi:hypothetical protein